MSEKALVKPQLKGLLKAQIKKNLTVAILLSFATGIAWKYGVSEPRKKRYAEFYKTYDAEKDFQRMKALGLFQSC